MRNRALWFILFLITCTIPVRAERSAVNYVSADAIYINAGRIAGVTVGAQIEVFRNGARIAVIEAIHVSSHSASCKIISKTADPAVGDTIGFQPVAFEAIPEPAAVPRESIGSPVQRTARVHGYVSLQNTWIEDQTGMGRSMQLPSMSLRLLGDNLFGTSARLAIRERTRFYPQPRTDGRSWSHRLSEFAVRYGDPRVGTSGGFGRMTIDEVHGLGNIDGGFVSIPISEHYRVGAVAGMDPPPVNVTLQTERSKAGTYVRWERSGERGSHAAVTAALSGSYVDNTVNREFIYLQGAFANTGTVYLYQSVEVDINRQWRMDANGGRLSFANLLTTATITPFEFLSLDANYDARQNVHNFETIATPDSLFDDATYRGQSGGATVSFPHAVQFRINGGVRHRGRSEETNRYYAMSLSMRRFVLPGHSLRLRWAVSETPFITAYRPAISDAFVLGRRTRLRLGAGAYIYDQGPVRNKSWFIEGGTYRTFGRRYFASSDIRQYVGGGIDSFQLFLEAGINL